MNLVLIAQIPIAIFLIWMFTTFMTASFPTLRDKRIALLIAHPDDEAMFFAPTLLSLSRKQLNNKIFILCLSSGDADGLGHIRKGELVRSALHLGITSPEHVVTIEDDRFVDSMTKKWDAKDISNILTHYFAPKVGSTPSSTAPPALIDVLMTFDEGGVSGHPNHISLFHGAKSFLQSLMKNHGGWDCPVKLYALTSTNVARKYSGILDSVTTVLHCIWRRKEQGAYPTPLLSVSGPQAVLKAQTAMISGHQSQMKWFRYGWIGISRYMIINDLVKIKVGSK